MEETKFVEDLKRNLTVLYGNRKDKAVIPFEEFTEKVFKKIIADAEDPDLFYDIMDEVNFE